MIHVKDLDQLIANGDLTSYDYTNVSDDGKVGVKSDNRNTQRLTLKFKSGRYLVIDTFCSGSSEDTVLDIRLSPFR